MPQPKLRRKLRHLTCPECGKEFVTTLRQVVYCTNQCARRNNHRKFYALETPKQRERRRVLLKEWKFQHPGRVNATSHAMRAKRKLAPGRHTNEQWMRCLEFHKYRCFYCDADLTIHRPTKDHVVPLAKGGSNDIENIVPACGPCNCRKQAQDISTFTQKLGLRG